MPSSEYLARLTSLSTNPWEVPHRSGDTKKHYLAVFEKNGSLGWPPGPAHGQAQPGSPMHHPVYGQEAVLGTGTPPKKLARCSIEP